MKDSRLFAASFDTLLSMLGIGVLLALPSLGYLLFKPVALLMQGVAPSPELTVFLPVSVERKAALILEQKLKAQPGVAKTRLIPREDTLARMKGAGGLADALAVLPDNPFSDAIVVTPADDDPATLEALAATLRQWREIEHLQMDADWARRLAAINRLLKAGGMLLAGLLGLALIAQVLNALRLQAFAHETIVRPSFLWQGVLLGLCGGLIAWLIVVAAIFGLRLPVAELAGLYGSTFTLRFPDALESAALLGISVLLGGCCAALAVDWRRRRT
ncbi:cell division protein FtsX [Sulfuricystis multivorans]|uniref:cell division protein FtsX n=1 Tax=Sulfuricystis multivorans TaxID=2211108 RepID=UPI000F81BEAF|nr:permease-like cell division protein FtsX [Sulfuricystis multivorans]